MSKAKITLDMREKLEASRVMHPCFSQIEAVLDHLVELSPTISTGYIVTIFGEYGLGKSTLFRDLEKRYPEHDAATARGESKQIPIFVIDAVESITNRKVVDAMCRKAGVTTTSSNNLDYLKNKAITLLRECGTLLFGIDEAHEFLNNSNRVGVKSVVSFVRSLADAIKIPVVLMGPHDYKDFVYSSGDLNRRVKEEYTLRQMGAPIDAQTEFYWTAVGMLEKLQEITGRRLDPSIDLLSFTQRLFLVTEGRIGCVFDFLAQYIVDQAKLGTARDLISLDDMQNTMKRYRPPFPLVSPAKDAWTKLSQKEIDALMDEYEFMDDEE
ncbi:TniB family NTP-binding protein [Litorivivens sp.]|uniref:TniB family NTP-binding protein n=1 Tax=Litorivivens sp. TaxID=2020868 RepID=UPI0035642219